MAITNRTLDISDKFAAACSPVIDSNYPTSGTITRSSIDHLSVSDLNSLFAPNGLFADLDAWFMHTIEMKACGLRRYSLYDWIMANADRSQYRANLQTVKGVKTQSLLQPFVFGRQESVVNRDYWKVVAGFKWNSSGGTDAAHADSPASITGNTTQFDKADAATWNPTTITKEDGSALAYTDTYVLRIENRHNIPLDVNWFRPREIIHVFTRSATGASEESAWKVLGAVLTTAEDGAKFLEVCVVSANFPTTNTAIRTPGAVAAFNGLVVPGINNVSDYEKWCKDLPTIDPRKKVPFWIQTRRTSRAVDSEYREVYKRLFATNPAFREFGDLPLAEKNKQDELEEQKRFVNAFFFNKPISANQTLTAWESLENIKTTVPATGTFGKLNSDGSSGKVMGKRANFVGVREQLRTADRVYDLASQRFDFYEFLDLNYAIARHRKTAGKQVKAIEWATNSVFRAILASAFVNYGQIEWGGNGKVFQGTTAMTISNSPIQVVVETNQVNKDLGMVYDTYRVKRPGGIDIIIYSDEFFDDFRDEFASMDMEGRGNLMLALDMGKPGPNGGTIYYAQIATNRKSYTSPEIDELAKYDSTFRCVMAKDTEEQTLYSETGTVIVEAPLCSAWLENFADEVQLTPHQNTGSVEPNLAGGDATVGSY